MLTDFVVLVVARMGPRAIPLAMIFMRKTIHGLKSTASYSSGIQSTHLGLLWTARAIH